MLDQALSVLQDLPFDISLGVFVLDQAFSVLQDLPFDMSLSVFVLDQALSVRALQEMVSAKSSETVSFFEYKFILVSFKYLYDAL